MANAKLIYTAEIAVTFEMSDSDFLLLWHCAANHYDSAVKAMTEQGGHLYGERNRRTIFAYTEEAKTQVSGKMRMLGRMCKALEFPYTAEGARLTRLIEAAMRGLNEQTALVNEKLSKL